MAEYNPSKIIKDGNTYNFRDTTKIPLAGSNAISGSLIPSTDNSIDIGSSTKNIKALYTKGITIDGTQFVPSDYIPRSGGAVITANNLARTTNDGYLTFSSGIGWDYGACVSMYGKDSAANAGVCLIRLNDGINDKIISFYPSGQFYFGPDFAFNSDASLRIGSAAGINTVLRHDGTFWTNANHLIPQSHSVIDLGWSDNAWKDCYLTNSPIVVSDARAKTQTQDVDDRLLDAWGNVEIKTYKLVSAVEKKGEKARYHTGYLAQDIRAECEKQGVNASDYGLFCYDEWDEQEEESEEIETEKDGKIVKEKRVIQPKREKGDRYSLRYEEALVVECKYLRRCIARLTARIEELEKGNNTK